MTKTNITNVMTCVDLTKLRARSDSSTSMAADYQPYAQRILMFDIIGHDPTSPTPPPPPPPAPPSPTSVPTSGLDRLSVT